MTVPILTPESLVALFSFLWSIALEYLPGLADWFAGLDFRQKQSVTGLGLLIIVVAAVALACTGVIVGAIACTTWQGGITNGIVLLLAALAINQGAHSLTKRAPAVKF